MGEPVHTAYGHTQWRWYSHWISSVNRNQHRSCSPDWMTDRSYAKSRRRSWKADDDKELRRVIRNWARLTPTRSNAPAASNRDGILAPNWLITDQMRRTTKRIQPCWTCDAATDAQRCTGCRPSHTLGRCQSNSFVHRDDEIRLAQIIARMNEQQF